jgi:hypothetical protein
VKHNEAAEFYLADRTPPEGETGFVRVSRPRGEGIRIGRAGLRGSEEFRRITGRKGNFNEAPEFILFVVRALGVCGSDARDLTRPVLSSFSALDVFGLRRIYRRTRRLQGCFHRGTWRGWSHSNSVSRQQMGRSGQ